MYTSRVTYRMHNRDGVDCFRGLTSSLLSKVLERNNTGLVIEINLRERERDMLFRDFREGERSLIRDCYSEMRGRKIKTKTISATHSVCISRELGMFLDNRYHALFSSTVHRQNLTIWGGLVIVN